MNIDAEQNLFIFDCDGTLVDSEYLCNLALEIKLKEYGVQFDAYALMERYRGWKLSNILESIQKSYDLVLSSAFVSEYRTLVAELFDTQLQPTKDIENTLQTIGTKMCVASSGPREKIKHALAICQLLKYFDPYIYSSYDIGSWKPEPKIFLHAANSFSMPPEKCIVVEDSELGIEAANRANMKSIFFNPHGLTIKATPTLEIKSMLELAELVR